MDVSDFIWWKVIPGFCFLFSIGLAFGNFEQDRANFVLNVIADSNSVFANDLYQVLASIEPQSNFAVSPFSLSTILTILKFGARGSTESDIKNGLRLSGVIEEELYTGLAKILNSLLRKQDNSNSTLDIVNSIYMDSQFEFNQEFLDELQRIFENNVKIESVRFAEDLQGSVSKINQWVGQVTQNRIPEVVSADSLSQDTKLILVNAMYFKGKWRSAFASNDTTKEAFYINDENSVEVDMMSQRGKFEYGEIDELNSKAVILPYDDEKLSLIIVLPNERSGLLNLEQKLQEFPLQNVREQLKTKIKMALHVSLPKTKLESTFDFIQNQVIKKLGMGSLLTKGADFSGISNRSLTVEQVIQKVFIELNEEGSEAAAVTSVGLTHRVSPVRPKYIPFKVDHPFLAFIYDDDTNSILFIARKLR